MVSARPGQRGEVDPVGLPVDVDVAQDPAVADRPEQLIGQPFRGELLGCLGGWTPGQARVPDISWTFQMPNEPAPSTTTVTRGSQPLASKPWRLLGDGRSVTNRICILCTNQITSGEER